MTTTNWPAPSPASTPAPSPGIDEPEPRLRRIRRAVVAVVAAGLAGAAIGIHRPLASIGIAIIVLVVAVATARASLLSRRACTLLAAGVVGFVPWLAIRSSPWLLILDLAAALVLAGLALSTGNGGSISDSVGGYMIRALRLARGVIDTPFHVHLGLRTTVPSEHRASLFRLGVPLAIGLAVSGLVALLLASGDALFASYLDLAGLAGTTSERFVAALLAVAITSAATGAAIASEDRPPVGSRTWVSPHAAIIGTAPLCAVYVAYVAVQVSSVVLGAEYVRRRTGMTFAEYARSGFFQLVAVAVLTFIGLVTLRPTLRSVSRGDRLVLLALSAIATACTVTMAVAAIVKLQLYADVFGLTMLRLYTTVFAAWLVIAIAIAFVSLLRPHGEWVMPLVAATALSGVFAMNVINPERVVAEHNLTTTVASESFDIRYLIDLSDDSVPIIIEHLGELDDDDALAAVRRLCAVSAQRSTGLDWNRARMAADRARDEIC